MLRYFIRESWLEQSELHHVRQGFAWCRSVRWRDNLVWNAGKHEVPWRVGSTCGQVASPFQQSTPAADGQSMYGHRH